VAGATHLYAIAIGSNRPHGRFGRPPGVVEAAIARLDEEFGLFDASPIILNPAMVLVWALGLMLAFNVDVWSQGWFHAKLFFVLALSGYQGWLGSYGKKLARGERPLSGKAVRMINEIPGVAAAIIVVLVIVRPF
jgi:uncharacterized integral membrane protein (TIGR00701 family)